MADNEIEEMVTKLEKEEEKEKGKLPPIPPKLTNRYEKELAMLNQLKKEFDRLADPYKLSKPESYLLNSKLNKSFFKRTPSLYVSFNKQGSLCYGGGGYAPSKRVQTRGSLLIIQANAAFKTFTCQEYCHNAYSPWGLFGISTMIDQQQKSPGFFNKTNDEALKILKTELAAHVHLTRK